MERKNSLYRIRWRNLLCFFLGVGVPIMLRVTLQRVAPWPAVHFETSCCIGRFVNSIAHRVGDVKWYLFWDRDGCAKAIRSVKSKQIYLEINKQKRYGTRDSEVIPDLRTNRAWRRLACKFEMGLRASDCTLAVSDFAPDFGTLYTSHTAHFPVRSHLLS